MGELAEIVGGGTPSTSVDSYWDGDIDWYAPAEIGEQIYLKSSQRKITEEGLNKSSAKVLPVGTVLFTSRAGIGKTAILLKEGCTNQGFQSIVPNKDKLDSYFIFTRSEELKRYVWHTTGSGKTLTSYKATRNLLMDIPAIDKAIFLIDRKDLDAQTTMAFQAYANNDLVDVDETDNVNDLKKKLKSSDRQVIVTTIQKMQILISKRLQEGTTEYSKIKNLKIAFVVDECHRAVTPKTKRELEKFFGRSLWYGFTGTPRFAENPYPQMGDLARTTEELYGKRLHKYTIQNAIHDNAVLGFQVEHNGAKNLEDETNASVYDNETHMLKVLDIILNKSFYKLGFQNGKGKTYEGLLTTSSIQLAQKYYELLCKVKSGETSGIVKTYFTKRRETENGT